MLQIAPPLSCARRRAIREVCRKQLLLHLADLPGSSRRLLRSQRVPCALHSGEAFHRGETHPEKACGLALGCASLEGVDYLLSEVFGVGFHACIISYGSTFLLTAVLACQETIMKGGSRCLEACGKSRISSLVFAYSDLGQFASEEGKAAFDLLLGQAMHN